MAVARHHGCPTQLSHEVGKAQCTWEGHDGAMAAVAALAERATSKQKTELPCFPTEMPRSKSQANKKNYASQREARAI